MAGRRAFDLNTAEQLKQSVCWHRERASIMGTLQLKGSLSLSRLLAFVAAKSSSSSNPTTLCPDQCRVQGQPHSGRLVPGLPLAVADAKQVQVHKRRRLSPDSNASAVAATSRVCRSSSNTSTPGTDARLYIFHWTAVYSNSVYRLK